MNKSIEVFFSRAINIALDKALQKDENVFLIGEDIALKGGAFGITRGLIDKYGRRRIVDSPISENSIVGLGIGASMTGLRPIIEIMYMDFIALAMDQILNKAAKLPFISKGYYSIPIVIRTTAGGGRFYGPDHSQSLEPLFINIPDIVIAVPSNPSDAYHMLLDSIFRDNPVLFVEYRKLYETRGIINTDEKIKIYGTGQIVSTGITATLVTYGRMLTHALKVKHQLKIEKGLDIEVIDLRYIRPLDKEIIFKSVAKTGRLITLEESPVMGGIGSEITALVAENNLYDLDSPPLRIGAEDMPIPFSVYLEERVLPSEKRIYETIVQYLGDCI